MKPCRSSASVNKLITEKLWPENESVAAHRHEIESGLRSAAAGDLKKSSPLTQWHHATNHLSRRETESLLRNFISMFVNERPSTLFGVCPTCWPESRSHSMYPCLRHHLTPQTIYSCSYMWNSPPSHCRTRVCVSLVMQRWSRNNCLHPKTLSNAAPK